nr:MAG TPA: hypothetical protein [Bacteriophage sp.]
MLPNLLHLYILHTKGPSILYQLYKLFLQWLKFY